MDKGKCKRSKRRADNTQVAKIASLRESPRTVNPDRFEGIFHVLEGDVPIISLPRPGSGDHTPASAYHSTHSWRDNSSESPSSMSERDSLSDRSTSPFEIIHDEATRDLVRTPSPDEYYSSPDTPGDSSDRSVSSQASEVGKKPENEEKNKDTQTRKGSRKTHSSVLSSNAGNLQNPSVIQANKHLEVPSCSPGNRHK